MRAQRVVFGIIFTFLCYFRQRYERGAESVQTSPIAFRRDSSPPAIATHQAEGAVFERALPGAVD